MATKRFDTYDLIDSVADDDEFTIWDKSAGALKNANRTLFYPAATLEEAQEASLTEGRLWTPESVGWAADEAVERATNLWRGRKLVIEGRSTATLAPDGAMQVPLLANHTYFLRGVFEMVTNDSGVTGGGRLNFTSPNLTAFDIRQRDNACILYGTNNAVLQSRFRFTGSGTSFAADDTFVGAGTMRVNGVEIAVIGLIEHWHEWTGQISVGTTGGIFAVQWAQFITTPAPEDPAFHSYMLPGSFIEVELQ